MFYFCSEFQRFEREFINDRQKAMNISDHESMWIMKSNDIQNELYETNNELATIGDALSLHHPIYYNQIIHLMLLLHHLDLLLIFFNQPTDVASNGFRAVRFQKVGGLDKMKEILSCHGDEEVLVTAVMNTLQNLAATKDGDLIKDLGRLHPYLACGLAQNNAKGL